MPVHTAVAMPLPAPLIFTDYATPRAIALPPAAILITLICAAMPFSTQRHADKAPMAMLFDYCVRSAWLYARHSAMIGAMYARGYGSVAVIRARAHAVAASSAARVSGAPALRRCCCHISPYRCCVHFHATRRLPMLIIAAADAIRVTF